MKIYNNKKSFANLPNRMHAWGTDSWCSDDEKKVYIELWFMQQIGDISEVNKKVFVTVDLITYSLGWETPKRNNKGRQRTIDALNGLQSKGYILFKGGRLTLKDLTPFTVLISGLDYTTVVEADAHWSQRNNVRQFYGYTKITSEEYNTLKEKYEFSLFSYIKWRENIKTYKISYIEWSVVLGVSESTAKRIISETVAIRKYQGAFNEALGKNNTNSYKAKKNTYKQAEKASESTEQVSEPVAETATESVVSNVKEPVVEKPVEPKEQLKTADNSVLDNEKVVSENEASLSQSEIEKMQYFDEIESQEKVAPVVEEVVEEETEETETVETNGYVASANFIYGMFDSKSNFDKMYDDLFDEEDDDETVVVEKKMEPVVEPKKVVAEKTVTKTVEKKKELPTDKDLESKSVMSLAQTKDDKIQEALMKQVTDKRVKNNMSLLRQIQDFGVGMTFQAYMIIKDTDDYKLRQWGKAKIKQIASNGENGLIKMQNFEKKYQKMQPKTGVSTDV